MTNRHEPRWTEQVRMFTGLEIKRLEKKTSFYYCQMNEHCPECDHRPESDCVFCEKELFKQPKARDLR